MPEVVEQEKELRFTRTSQGVIAWLVAAVALMVAITLGVVSLYRAENPALPHPAWSLIPIFVSLVAVRLAVHLTRHAYLILTPLGIDVFPFFRPVQGMRTVFWAEIKAMDADLQRGRLTLHFNDEKTSGVVLTLRPIARAKWEWLVRAVEGRVGCDVL